MDSVFQNIINNISQQSMPLEDIVKMFKAAKDFVSMHPDDKKAHSQFETLEHIFSKQVELFGEIAAIFPDNQEWQEKAKDWTTAAKEIENYSNAVDSKLQEQAAEAKPKEQTAPNNLRVRLANAVRNLQERQNSDAKISKSDEQIAKDKMEEYINEGKGFVAGMGGNAVLDVLANVADKFSRDNNGNFNHGWFYTFVASNLLSGATRELLENLMAKKYVQNLLAIQHKQHQEFDSFPITERESRKIEGVLNDQSSMLSSTNGYLGSKGNLTAAAVSATAFVGLSMLSGGTAALPIIGGVMAVSGVSSYFFNKKMNEKKIAAKNAIREGYAKIQIRDRHLYKNSKDREINDINQKEYRLFEQEQKAHLSRYDKLIKMLSKFTALKTVAKTAVIASVVALSASNPANMLVVTAAALGAYNATERFINARFSVKEHIGNFSKAYKSFMSKVKDINYGTEKINARANVIELDHIAFKHREETDLTKRKDEVLFELPETIRITPGITLLSGTSGAGKSSLTNLLMHSDNVSRGAIRIGEVEDGQFKGIDYKDLAFGEPARHIGFDLQNGNLSSMTVNEYITLANPNAKPEKVNEVKELLGITDHPQNNSDINANLVLDNDGRNISGGQINRLKLAQTLIKDSPIMVLDEPTTGIDAAMKPNIINYINNLKDEKTIVYITHNVDEIRNLKTMQAIDIDKPSDDKTAIVTRYDLTNPQVKENYINLFSNRRSSPSPVPTVMADDINQRLNHAKNLKEKLEQRKNPVTETTASINQTSVLADSIADTKIVDSFRR